MPGGREMGSGARKMSAAPRKRKQTKTVRGPQGLPTQASSTQRETTPPSRKRPAPQTQPGPIRAVERRQIERHKQSPTYQRRLKQTRAERRASATRTGMADADRRRVENYQRSETYQRLLADVREQFRPDEPGILERIGQDIIRNTPIGLPVRLAGLVANEDVQRRVPGVAGLHRELAGEGEIVSGVGRFAKWIAENTRIVPTGTGSVSGSAVGGQRTQIASARPVKPPEGVKRFTEDMINFPAQAIPSLYVPAAAGVEAVQGDTRRASKLVEDFKEQDPIYALLTGDFEEAGRRAAEHPGFTALEIAGVKGAVGRGAGRVVRGAGMATGSETLRNIGAIHTRPNATRPGTNLAEERRYSRDLINKAFQKGSDRRRAQRAVNLREKANEIELADPTRAVELRRQANDVDPTYMSDRDIARRVDLREQQNFQRTRRETGEIDALASEIISQSGDPGAGLSLVAQGITRADPDDLIAYRDELATAYNTLEDPAKRAANVELRNAIDDTLKQGRKRKGRDLPARIQAAARRYAEEVDKPLDRALADLGLLPEARGERAKLVPPAAREGKIRTDPEHFEDFDGNRISADEVRAMRESFGDDQVRSMIRHVPERFVDEDGKPISDKRLREIAQERGINPDQISYISQSPSAQSPGAYYRSSAREPVIGSRRRTEKPTLEGTFDATPESLRARAMNARGLAVAADNWRQAIGEAAVRNSDGDPYFATFADADQRRRALEQSTGSAYRVVNARPWQADRAQFEAMLERMGEADDPRLIKDFHESFGAGLRGQGAEGHFAVVPKAWADQMQEHLGVLGPGDFDRTARAVRSMFTGTVLAVSPSPTIGNFVEGTFRAIINRAGPRSYLTAKNVLKALAEEDPALAQALRDRAIPGGRVRLATTKRYLDPKALKEGGFRKMVARWQQMKRVPGMKQGTRAWQAWQWVVFEQINGRMEEMFQTAQLGKAIRDSGLISHELVKTSNKAYREAARGLKNTPMQAKLAQDVYDSYGKYAGFSPKGRRWIAEYSPFAAWFISSWQFLGKVLPRDHPTMVALTAANLQLTEEWRKNKNLQIFLWGDGENLPGWLRGTLDVGGTRWQVTRNTPFAVATDPLTTASGSILPQFSTLLDAMEGRDWKGKQLRHDDGREYNDVEKLAYGIYEMGKATIPALALPDRAAKYISDPSTFLNPARIKPQGNTRGSNGKSSGGTRQLDPLLEAELEAMDAGAGTIDPDLLEAELEAMGR